MSSIHIHPHLSESIQAGMKVTFGSWNYPDSFNSGQRGWKGKRGISPHKLQNEQLFHTKVPSSISQLTHRHTQHGLDTDVGKDEVQQARIILNAARVAKRRTALDTEMGVILHYCIFCSLCISILQLRKTLLFLGTMVESAANLLCNANVLSAPIEEWVRVCSTAPALAQKLSNSNTGTAEARAIKFGGYSLHHVLIPTLYLHLFTEFMKNCGQ